MKILKDEIHDCINCENYPCSLKEDISNKDVCKDCISTCCQDAIIVILPCEQGVFKEGTLGLLKMNDDGWCYYFDHENRRCSIYEKRPVACRVSSCSFIREGKVPDRFKKLGLNADNEYKEDM
jgi:Fe-S-cluster containining protein